MRDIWRILKSARELWPLYVVISLLTIVVSLMSQLLPLLSGWAIDEVGKGTGARVNYVAWLAFAIFALDVAQNLFSNLGGYLGDQMSIRLNTILRTRYYRHIMSLPQTYFDTELSGKIVNRLSRSIQQITTFMQMFSNNFLQFIFTTIFTLIAVSIYSWQVALMLLLLYPIYIYMTFRTSGVWQQYQATKNRHEDIATGRFTEAVGQIKVVKSYNQQAHELSLFKRHMKVIQDTTKPQSRFWHTRDVRRRLILNVIFWAVHLYIFVQAARGGFSPGQAVALILYAMQIRTPIFTITFLVETTQRAIADSRDYFEAMAVEPEVEEAADAKPLRVKRAAVQFDNVSFAYQDGQPVLHEINFEIQPGSKVALVGESGEGKTTLTNLLLRLYEPQTGRILIDGQDIRQITLTSLRKNIAVVFQDPALFSGTIRENIAYDRPQASLQAVKAAARAANADEFISRLDKGYETEIGERGLKLSGGQKQRIAIARALLKDAPILVLDEATSSLDSRSEVMVQEALERLMEGRTTIIIAHRLSTIQSVDTIVTLKAGRIDEIGSPAELAKTDGIYAQLLALQRREPSERRQKKLQQFEIAE